MLYIDQLCTPSFLIGLVKTESGFIARSVETGLVIWMIVVAVISVDAYPFLAFKDLTCHLEDTGRGVLWLHSVPPNCKETKLRSSNQEPSPSASKNTGVVLVSCSRMKVHSYSYCWWCGCFWGPWTSFFMTDELSVRAAKITSRIGDSWTYNLLFYF